MYTIISTPNFNFFSFVNSINFYETNKFTETQLQKIKPNQEIPLEIHSWKKNRGFFVDLNTNTTKKKERKKERKRSTTKQVKKIKQIELVFVTTYYPIRSEEHTSELQSQ